MVGQSHFKTFDNKFFTFTGRCQYLLARDCTDSEFSVIIENVQVIEIFFFYLTVIFITFGHLRSELNGNTVYTCPFLPIFMFQCADDQDAVCTRSVTLSLPSLDDMTVKLKHGGMVSVNGMDIQTPMHHGTSVGQKIVKNLHFIVLVRLLGMCHLLTTMIYTRESTTSYTLLFSTFNICCNSMKGNFDSHNGGHVNTQKPMLKLFSHY